MHPEKPRLQHTVETAPTHKKSRPYLLSRSRPSRFCRPSLSRPDLGFPFRDCHRLSQKDQFIVGVVEETRGNVTPLALRAGLQSLDRVLRCYTVFYGQMNIFGCCVIARFKV